MLHPLYAAIGLILLLNHCLSDHAFPNYPPLGISYFPSTFELGNLTYLIDTQWNMAAIYEAEMGFHAGEEEMHKLLNVPQRDNPTSPFLTPFASQVLLRSPLVALGTLDKEGRPWTTLWGGEPGFSRAIAQGIIGVKTTVEKTYDPVLETLFAGKADGEVVQETGKGRMVGGLAIDLEGRKRVKLFGRMVAGALAKTEEGVGEVQLVVKIEQSLGAYIPSLHPSRASTNLYQAIAQNT